ncbi:MAG: hypothetical protein KAQ62_09020, partial [Cyclobacteriaceae bacterium]|nr:hypothetical protein [Cyclobacteriaceae bacterium]
MKQFRFFVSIVCILTLSLQTFAQGGGNNPERFYNVESYKANITLTFKYQLSHSEPEFASSASAYQTFQHFFTTASGQITVGDMFQIERGDEGENETHEGDMFGGIDMSSLAQALENSGVDPSVMDMVKESKKEAQPYHISADKYKNWMVTGAGGLVTSSIYSKFSEESSGTLHCGEGGGSGHFRRESDYNGSEHIGPCKPGMSCPNSFILQLNLENNTYSFSTSVEMPRGSQFLGSSSHYSSCGSSSNEQISRVAHSFMSVKESAGVIYKHPLPESGLILSGSEIITDESTLAGGLSEDGKWSVKIDWTIYPSDMGVPEVFISYDNDEAGKKWIPEDGNTIEAIMEWEGNYKPEIIEWELFNVSAEPGTCLNSKDKNEEFDLEFEESLKEKGYSIVKTEYGYRARKEGNIKVGKESILLKSNDFGSYGILSGKVRVNGIWCEARQKDLGKNWLTVPWDKNENNIADKWEKENQINDELPNNWDEEIHPVLDGFPGDGFSLYEEYRGLISKDKENKEKHTRLDPNIKELIVVNEIGPEIQPGLKLFESASEIKVIVLNEGELPESRIVNSNYATGHNQDQYGVIFKENIVPYDIPDGTIAGAYPLEKLNKSPKETDFIYVNTSVFKPKNDNQANDQNQPGDETASQDDNCKLKVNAEVAARFRNETIAHELGHAVGANHHGDVDAFGETLSYISIDR